MCAKKVKTTGCCCSPCLGLNLFGSSTKTTSRTLKTRPKASKQDVLSLHLKASLTYDVNRIRDRAVVNIISVPYLERRLGMVLGMFTADAVILEIPWDIASRLALAGMAGEKNISQGMAVKIQDLGTSEAPSKIIIQLKYVLRPNIHCWNQ